GTLLTWMQERPAPVFLMATSNDVTKLPPEFLRRGRFDEIFFVDLPEAEDRLLIFEIHFRQREWSPDRFDLERLAALSEGFSGAEIEAVVVAALYHAFSENQPLQQSFLEEEIAAARPLSQLRPEDIQALREWGHRHARLA
ncbi:MAG: AAA family ATPase, partial [Acidobacteriota bacterium]